MVVITDASPVILLGKLDSLNLITDYLGNEILLPRAVYDEIFGSGLTPGEEHLLLKFVSLCKVEKVRRPRTFSAGLSDADNAALTLAVRRMPSKLLSDDLLLRIVARLEGVNCIGTLGLIQESCKSRLLSKNEAKKLVDELLDKHKLRISIKLYREVITALDSVDAPEIG